MILRLLVLALLAASPVFAATYSSVVTALDPCHWWKMNESSGNIQDSKTDATCTARAAGANGTPTYSQTGIPFGDNNAIRFTSSHPDQFISGGSANEFQMNNIAAASWVFWVKPVSHAVTQTILSVGIGGTWRGTYCRRGTGQGLACSLDKDDNSGTYGQGACGAATCTLDNTWHMAMFSTTASGGAVSLFTLIVDGTGGTVNTSSSVSGSPPSCAGHGGGSCSLMFGEEIIADSQGYDGYMDEVAYFRSALSNANTDLLYNCGFSGACGGATPPRRIFQSRHDEDFERLALPRLLAVGLPRVTVTPAFKIEAMEARAIRARGQYDVAFEVGE